MVKLPQRKNIGRHKLVRPLFMGFPGLQIYWIDNSRSDFSRQFFYIPFTFQDAYATVQKAVTWVLYV